MLPLTEPASKHSDTPIAVAYKRGHWEVVKYLAKTHHYDTKGDHENLLYKFHKVKEIFPCLHYQFLILFIV